MVTIINSNGTPHAQRGNKKNIIKIKIEKKNVCNR